MTFDQLVEKGKQGQWATAEAAFLVKDEASYGEGALARFAEALGIGYQYATKLAKAWQRRSENLRLTQLSQSAVMELISVPDDKLDEVLDVIESAPKPTQQAARKAAEPYREAKPKSRKQIEQDAALEAINKADGIIADLERIVQEILPDVPTTNETKRILLDRFESMQGLIAKGVEGLVGIDFEAAFERDLNAQG